MEDEKGIAFVDYVRETFPESAARADQLMVQRGYDHDELQNLFAIWLSAFADVTGEEMTAGSTDKVKAHFRFFSNAYDTGSREVRSLVDVDYVENLYWRIPEEICARYWSMMPSNLRQLYVNFHGSPPA